MTCDLQYVILNGKRVIATPFFLKALVAAHNELVQAKIGVLGMMGFVPSSEMTNSWRSLATQRQLVLSGSSKTLYSNHRRGTAVDCYADRSYIERIKPIMEKHGLVNDLAPWDAVHWNWKSNVLAAAHEIFDEIPSILTEYSDMEYDNHILQLTQAGIPGSGAFALVYGGKKHIVAPERLPQAAMTVFFRGMTPSAVTLAVWDSIPTGDNF